MACEAVIVFFGVRYAVSSDDIELLENRTFPPIIAARKNGMKHYWGNFNENDPKYFLFIGDKLGIFGVENEREFQVSSDSLLARISQTRDRLAQAGFLEEPQFFVHWQPSG
jgi:hypothetical protein